jgi:hypothetical protein
MKIIAQGVWFLGCLPYQAHSLPLSDPTVQVLNSAQDGDVSNLYQPLMRSRCRMHRRQQRMNNYRSVQSTEDAIEGLNQDKGRKSSRAQTCMLCVRASTSATDRSLVQRSPTKCDVSKCV